MYDHTAPLGPDGQAEPRLTRDQPAAERHPSPRHRILTDTGLTDIGPTDAGPTEPDLAVPELTEPGAADLDNPDAPSAQVLKRIEATAAAAGALQSALIELELELARLQHTVRRASPAMAQLMQAATEMRAAGIDDPEPRW